MEMFSPPMQELYVITGGIGLWRCRPR